MQSQLKLKCLDGSQGPKTPGAQFSEKNVLFLKFIGLVTPLWVLYPSEIMYMGSTEPLLASAVLARSIKVLGWQPGAPNFREHDFPKKSSFFEFQRTIDTSMGSAALEIMHMVSTESLLARAVFTKSIKVLGWQARAPKHGNTIFRRKNVLFFEFHRTSDTSSVSVSL